MIKLSALCNIVVALKVALATGTLAHANEPHVNSQAQLPLAFRCGATRHRSAVAGSPTPEPLSFKLVDHYPHRNNAFSQGLIFHQGYIYESTGLYGQSMLARYPLGQLTPDTSQTLDDKYFGEGLAMVDDELVVLTWKSGDVLRYRLTQNTTDATTQSDSQSQANTFELTATQQIESEGWGLTSNGTSLVSSDGSSALTFRNLETLKPEKKIIVRVMDRPVKHLNELEWANGCIMANIWGSDTVVLIDPTDGQVRYTIDLASLAKRERNDQANVTNGIAYRHDNGNVLVTGKNWQHIYELELSNAAQ